MLPLNQFFDLCMGRWTIERTYHYLPEQRSERSHTNYYITPLSDTARAQVLQDNQQTTPTGYTGGFHLDFDTISETGEKTAMSLNILFVPTQADPIEGVYLRDRAYEEQRPIAAHFRYDPDRSEMLMTTPYTQVVSVDSITFVNPDLRLRRILNYRRAPVLTEPLLIGFGIEQRV
ncbi:phycobiliprotein lyase [Candidatus Cyanaurora vandensis]|uniref:phycobiliprotein lyase n=1 Tax=Candidatus Cyanaurora vandensis TaxID=2714958 RepID=UPI00257B7B4B|nr:phycobiliprotein lyase [Candidatus Cyanaurora vandensis]